MIPWLPPESLEPRGALTPFPSTREALGEGTPAPGLLCAGANLGTRRLEAAYRQGIFPWFGEGEPILWWSTAPRMVLQVEQFRVHRSLKKVLRKFAAMPGCDVSIDTDCPAVITACSGTDRKGQGGTWIVPAMVQAYIRWHHAAGPSSGVHSFETRIDGELVGGLYGVSIGRMFYGESMFAHATDASKIALAALVAWCRGQGISWIDCQQQTGHLASLGAAPVSREMFEKHLSRVTVLPRPCGANDWSYDPTQWSRLGLNSAD
jgi:leucyl/phenylalanyl-tRNA--protein transferase